MHDKQLQFVIYMSDTNNTSYLVKLFYICLFAVAIGYFEAMVVVYLRELYYPDGFSLPLKIIPARMIILEVLREAASIVIIVCLAALAGRKFWERFGYFIIIFGIWDVSYYIWLKITLDWPSSLFDWDVLFLIPLPWIGPVIAPLLIAVLMVIFGISITCLFHKGYDFRPTWMSWILAVAGTFLLLYSFMCDFTATLHQMMPEPYNYIFLCAGLVCYVKAYVISYREVMKTKA